MIKLKLVDNTFGASYNGHIAYIKQSSIDSYVIRKPYGDYPKCVTLYVNEQEYRVRFSDFKELKMWKVRNE